MHSFGANWLRVYHTRQPLAAHEQAFAHFGGRCAELLYDRMRTVVLGTTGDGSRWNASFAAFAKHWGFEPRLCRPYRAQTRGKVESGVKYVKRNFVPGRLFRDLDNFNDQLAQWLTDVADVRLHGTTHQRPIERFAEEAGALVPTAGHASFLQACQATPTFYEIRRHPSLRISGLGVRSRSLHAERLFEVTQAVAATFDVEHMRLVQEPVEDGGGQHLVAGE